MRVSVADALGYTFDETPDFNLHLPPLGAPSALPQGAPVAMLFHATSAAEKKWPIDRWAETGRWLTERGYSIALPWGTEGERREGEQIAALVPGAVVLPKLSVTECAHCIDESAIVVGMDTGLVHLAHALVKPTVMIFTATSSEHFGISAPRRSVSVGDHFAPPDVAAVLDAIRSVMPGAEPSSANPVAVGQASS
jgi:heptosyltransferase-1